MKVSYSCEKELSIAISKMFEKHIQLDRKKLPRLYKMDVLTYLGGKGWELIMITGKEDSSNKTFYFKREK